jgi:hypothetical protein
MTLTSIYGSAAYCTSADADPTLTIKGFPTHSRHSDGRNNQHNPQYTRKEAAVIGETEEINAGKYRGELAGLGVERGEGVAARVGAEGGVRGCWRW